jgi:DNA replication licensing factor MCM5
MEDIAGFDENLADKLKKQPSEHLSIFEEAAREVADEITFKTSKFSSIPTRIQPTFVISSPTWYRDLSRSPVSSYQHQE